MKTDYLIRKKPFLALLTFSVPMIVGSLFQHLYTMADSVIVGRYVSEQALAAVGASYSLTNIFVCVALGGGIGASVMVSRYFGEGDYTRMKRAISTSLISFLLLSLLLGIFGLAFGGGIMRLLKTPPDALPLATEYLSIYFMGLPFLFMYNVLSSAFNALGKSQIPLCFLIFSSIFNVALDFILVTRFGLGVAGVAWATLIAQGISAALSFVVLLRELKTFPSEKTELLSKTELLTMARIALPSILQQSTVSIGMMLVQSVVNSFGSEALAGFSAAIRIESLCVVPMVGIGNALSSYTAQNLGARKPERVTQGYRVSNRMVAVCAVAICLMLELFYRPIILLFLGAKGTAVAISTGQSLLRFEAWFFCLIGFKMAVDGLLRGAGDMKMFTIANLVNLTIRVTFSAALAPKYGIAMVWYAVPIGWLANWIISYAQYRTGKWRAAGSAPAEGAAEK